MRKQNRSKVREFEPSFLIKIREFINNDLFEKAESSIKKALRVEGYKNTYKSTLYSLLGEIQYIKGNYRSAKRFYTSSLKYNSSNEFTLYNVANFYLYEQEPDKALPYIEKNLKMNPGKIKHLNQYAWCLVMIGDYKRAEILYQKLIKSNNIDPQGFVDISMTLVSQGKFDKARQVIYTGMGKFPESYLVEDAMFELSEIEGNFQQFRRDIYFRRLNELATNSALFTSGFRRLVEGMSIRGYFQFEIEKSADLLIELSNYDINFPNQNLLAALCEFIISESVGDYSQLYQNVSSYYGTSVYMLKKWYNILKDGYPELLEKVTLDLVFIYNDQFDGIIDELSDEGDDE